MNEVKKIISEVTELKSLIYDQGILKKEVINFREAHHYLDISASHLYKLTSQKRIPHFCPEGKRLFFNRLELDQWLQRNRQLSNAEIEQQASNYLLNKKRNK